MGFFSLLWVHRIPISAGADGSIVHFMKRLPVLLLASACAPAAMQTAVPSPAPKHALASEATPVATDGPPAPPPAETPQPVIDARTMRLARLCKLWGLARFIHPSVVRGTVDWDAALVAALPRALAAQTDDEEAEAARALLGALHDPATRVEKAATDAPKAATRVADSPMRTVDGVVIVSAAISSLGAVDSTAERLEKDLAGAKLAVIDLRSMPADDFTGVLFQSFGPRLAPHPARALAYRVVEHQGYHQQKGSTSGAYDTWLMTRLPTEYPEAPKLHLSRVVFLTNTAAGVPDVAWGMQRAGDAAVVVQGPLGQEQLAPTDELPLGGGYVAHVRGAELVGTPPQPDAQLPADAEESAVIAAAVRAAKHAVPAKTATKVSPDVVPAWRPDARYEDEPYPSRERRILASSASGTSSTSSIRTSTSWGMRGTAR